MCDASEKFYASSYGHDQRTNRKRQYSLSNSDANGTTLPRVNVLAFFYESVNRLTETKEIEKKKTTTTKTDVEFARPADK